MTKFGLQLCIVVLAAVSLSACLGGSPTLRYYLLSDTPAKSLLQPQQQAPAIEIAAIHIPQYLDRPQIVSRTASSRLRLSESHQWGGNLRKNLIRAMVSNLSVLLDTAQIRSNARRNSEKPDYRIEVEIMEFEKAIDGRIHLTAKWQIKSIADKRIVNTQISRLVSKQLIKKDDYDALVQAMSELYGQLSNTIAVAIYRHLPAA